MALSDSGAAVMAMLEIKPNRRYLDDRFPVLGFTLSGGRAGYYEVLLTTDRMLFDPGSAGKRNGMNFYSSRQDSKLISMSAGQAVYLVPTAVLKSFAKAQTGAFEIYYAAVSYATADAQNPIFSQAPEALRQTAPSVPVAASFRGHAIPVAFGMSNRMNGRSVHSSNGQHAASNGVRSAGLSIDAKEDRAEGEDGSWASPLDFSVSGSNGHGIHAGNGLMKQAATSNAASSYYDDGYAYEEEAPQAARTKKAAPAAMYYSDGYEGAAASSQSAEFAAGTHEPMPLATGYDDDEDEDDRRSSVRLYAAAAQKAGPKGGPETEPRAAAAEYGDEADEWDRESLPPYRALDDSGAAAAPPLTIETRRDLIRKLGEYSATVADGEFEGDYGKKDAAYHRYHRGLSFGVVLFNQDEGDLGKLLSMMKERNEVRFREVFGDGADELLRVTNAPGPKSKDSAGGRSARVQPVSGSDLWMQPWLSMFEEAGDETAFQSAQNQLASSLFLDPMLWFASMLGFKTERLLAALVTCAAGMGVENAKQWVTNTVSPVQTPAQRQQALAALKQKDVTSFQKATSGLEATGHWDPDTHAAVLQALRGLTSSSLPIATPDQMLAAMVRRSAGMRWTERLQHVADAHEMGDSALGF